MFLGASFLFGSLILDFFGISLVVIQIAGGLVVAATGWTLLNQRDSTSDKRGQPDTLEDAKEHAFLSPDAADHGRPGLYFHRDYGWELTCGTKRTRMGAWLQAAFPSRR